MEAFGPLAILAAVLSNVLSSKTEKLLESGWQKLSHHSKPDKLTTTDELEKALKRAFLSALQVLALECHQELLGSSVMKYRGKPNYPLQHQDELSWLDKKLKQLAIALKRFDQGKPFKAPLITLDDIELFLNPSGQLSELNQQIAKETLIKEALSYDAPVPSCYSQKVKECLIRKLEEHFSSEILHNPVLASFFEIKLLTEIKTTLNRQQQRIEALEESQRVSTPSTRWEVKLDVDIEELNTVPLEEIIKQLKQLSGDGTLTIRVIKEGSIVLVFEGSQAGFEKIQALYQKGQLKDLLGVSIEDICLESAPAPERKIVNLSQWLHNIIDVGWQTIDQILSPPQVNYAFAVRGTNTYRVIRAIDIELGQEPDRERLALVVDLMPPFEQKNSILILMYPQGEQIYLPQGLKAVLVDSSGNIAQEITANNNKFIRFEIGGQVGEEFGIKIDLGENQIRQNFVI